MKEFDKRDAEQLKSDRMMNPRLDEIMTRREQLTLETGRNQVRMACGRGYTDDFGILVTDPRTYQEEQ